MLNVSDRATERTLLENLSQEDPELVEEIRRLMFIFEDIVKFNDKEIQTLLKNVESLQWGMALKGASSELKEKIFGNMSSRAGEMMQEDLEAKGPVRLKDVEEAQKEILTVARRLAEAGEIVLGGKGDDEYV